MGVAKGLIIAPVKISVAFNYSGICANSHLIWQVTLTSIIYIYQPVKQVPKYNPSAPCTNLCKQATSV